MSAYKRAETYDEHKNLYRADVHYLVEKFGVGEVRRLVDELMSEVTFVPNRELLRPRGIGDEDMVRIHETWGKRCDD